MEATEEFKDGRERVSLQPQYDVGKFPPKVKFPHQNSWCHAFGAIKERFIIHIDRESTESRGGGQLSGGCLEQNERSES